MRYLLIPYNSLRIYFRIMESGEYLLITIAIADSIAEFMTYMPRHNSARLTKIILLKAGELLLIKTLLTRLSKK